MRTTNIYVDGFNLYHNSLKKRNLYWLDIQSFVQSSLESFKGRNAIEKEYTINQIKYFTAPIKLQKREPHLSTQQKLYIKALHTFPNFEVIMGRFSIMPQSCPIITDKDVLNQWKSFSTQKKHKFLKKIQGYFHNKTVQDIENQLINGPNQKDFISKLWKKIGHKDKIKLAKKLFKEEDTTTQRYVKVEEKGTDVNLATHLLLDAFDNQYDCAVIISNDSDFELPIKKVITKFKKQIILLIPGAYISKELKSVIEQSKNLSSKRSFYQYIKESDLRKNQFPDIVNGILKPKSEKSRSRTTQS